jgi:hypothetical protein
MVFQDAAAGGSANLAGQFRLPADTFDMVRGFPQALEGQDFFADLKHLGDVLVELGEITAAVSGELHVPELEVTDQAALGILRLVQAEHDHGIFKIFKELVIA